MSDAMTQLFTAALGLAAPWRVKALRLAPAAQEIHFDVVCEATRLPCPRGAAPEQRIHDRLTAVRGDGGDCSGDVADAASRMWVGLEALSFGANQVILGGFNE